MKYLDFQTHFTYYLLLFNYPYNFPKLKLFLYQCEVSFIFTFFNLLLITHYLKAFIFAIKYNLRFLVIFLIA